jgi:hypothetical protein
MMTQHDFTRMMNEIMKTSGEEFEIVRDGNVRTLIGAKNTQKNTNRKYVQFHPGTDVKVGDTLIRKITGDTWTVVEVDPYLIQGQIFSVNTYYQTGVERSQQQPQSVVNYTFHNSSNIIAGSQTTAILTVNTKEIEAEIERNGGHDKEDLLAMVAEIKEALEKKDVLAKNSLAKFSETLERHSWITGSLVQLLGSAAMQFLIG